MKTLAGTRIDLSTPKYFRKGIRTHAWMGGVYEQCDKHGKKWLEGSEYKHGACKECIENAMTI